MLPRHALVLSVAVVAFAAPAAAGGDSDVELGHQQSAAEHDFLLGFKAAAGGQFGKVHQRFGRGVGVFAERPVIPGWLDLELVLIAAEVHSELLVPLDLLAKKPFHWSHNVHGYLGIGASLTLEQAPEGNELRPGLAGAAGVYVWIDRRWGLDLEVDYNYLLDQGGLHELNVAVGPVVRF